MLLGTGGEGGRRAVTALELGTLHIGDLWVLHQRDPKPNGISEVVLVEENALGGWGC